MVATRQAVELLLCLEFFRVYQLLPLSPLSTLQFRSALRGCGFLRNCTCHANVCRGIVYCTTNFEPLIHYKPVFLRFTPVHPWGEGLAFESRRVLTHVPYSEPSRRNGSPHRATLVAQNIRSTNATTQCYLSPQQAIHEITN